MKKARIKKPEIVPPIVEKNSELNLDDFLKSIKKFLNAAGHQPIDKQADVDAPCCREAIEYLQNIFCKNLIVFGKDNFVLTADGKRLLQYAKAIEREIFIITQQSNLEPMRVRRDFLLRKLIHDMKTDSFN